jgi:hypothetical protein
MLMSADASMGAYAATLPVPEFETTAFTTLDKPLSEARVAIVTSAALHRPGQDRFSQADIGFRPLDRADRELVMGHWSPNLDHTGFQLDLGGQVGVSCAPTDHKPVEPSIGFRFDYDGA